MKQPDLEFAKRVLLALATDAATRRLPRDVRVKIETVAGEFGIKISGRD